MSAFACGAVCDLHQSDGNQSKSCLEQVANLPFTIMEGEKNTPRSVCRPGGAWAKRAMHI